MSNTSNRFGAVPALLYTGSVAGVTLCRGSIPCTVHLLYSYISGFAGPPSTLIHSFLSVSNTTKCLRRQNERFDSDADYIFIANHYFTVCLLCREATPHGACAHLS